MSLNNTLLFLVLNKTDRCPESWHCATERGFVLPGERYRQCDFDNLLMEDGMRVQNVGVHNLQLFGSLLYMESLNAQHGD